MKNLDEKINLLLEIRGHLLHRYYGTKEGTRRSEELMRKANLIEDIINDLREADRNEKKEIED